MAKTKLTLTDTHLVILSTASARDGLNLIPLPECLGKRDERIDTILDDLVRHKLAADQVGVPLDQTWRTVDDQRVGLVITPAGLKAIGIEVDCEVDGSDAEVEVATDEPPSIKPTRTATKTQQVAASLALRSAIDWSRGEPGARLRTIAVDPIAGRNQPPKSPEPVVGCPACASLRATL